MFGKPVIKGTRITVELILIELETGKEIAEILKSHPNLSEEKILAAKAYAKFHSLKSDALSKIYAERAMNAADKIWDERGYTNELMKEWLNSEDQ